MRIVQHLVRLLQEDGPHLVVVFQAGGLRRFRRLGHQGGQYRRLRLGLGFGLCRDAGDHLFNLLAGLRQARALRHAADARVAQLPGQDVARAGIADAGRELQPQAQARARVDELLKLVGLPGIQAKYPAQLSGGQQQRIALARALVFDPKLVLMDEPLGALDKQLREHMQFEIKHLHESLGITVVYVTHDQGEALTMSDRVAVFNDGRIQQLAPPADLYERPENSFVAQFIGENNKLPGTIEELNGDKALVRLATGEVIDATAVNIKEKGQKTLVSIRPERVEFKPEMMPAGAHMISAEVLEVVYMGDIFRTRMRVAGSDNFVMKSRNTIGQTKLKPGEQIKIGWHPEDARALDTV